MKIHLIIILGDFFILPVIIISVDVSSLSFHTLASTKVNVMVDVSGDKELEHGDGYFANMRRNEGRYVFFGGGGGEEDCNHYCGTSIEGVIATGMGFDGHEKSP